MFAKPNDRFQALIGVEEKEQLHIPNLDTFLVKVYNYYVSKGFSRLVVSRLLNLLTVAFTICFSTFLLLYVDWGALTHCSSSHTCSEISAIRHNALESISGLEALAILYFTVFLIYWLWNVWSFIDTVRWGLGMKHFFNEQLRISDDQLETLEWYCVLDRVVDVQDKVKLSIVRDLNALDITNIILRKDNYMIALMNMDVLDMSITIPETRCTACLSTPELPEEEMENVLLPPLPRNADHSSPRKANPFQTATESRAGFEYQAMRSPRSDSSSSTSGDSGDDAVRTDKALAKTKPRMTISFFGRSLEWSIRFCLLDSMFDSQMNMRGDLKREDAIAEGVVRLQRRFIIVGVLNLLLLPFIMIFMVFFFFLRHAEEFHRRKEYLGPSEWTSYARWKLREFNELDHFFEQRLKAGYTAAANYVDEFPNTITSIVAQAVSYIAGAFVAILLLFAFVDTSLLSNLEVGDRSLVWWLAVFTAILALCRSFIPAATLLFEPERRMREVVKFTHYMPLEWAGRCNTAVVRSQFEQLFKKKAMVFVVEVLSVLCTPLVLCFSLPRSAERIVRFIARSTVTVPGVGDVCAYALFDFERRGDRRYLDPFGNPANPADADAGGDTGGAANTTATATTDDAAKEHRRKPQTDLQHGKMEKSFVSFAVNHPNWQPSQRGSHLLASLAAGTATMSQSNTNSNSVALHDMLSRDLSQLPLSRTSSAGSEFDPLASPKLPGVGPPASQVGFASPVVPAGSSMFGSALRRRPMAMGSPRVGSVTLDDRGSLMAGSFADLMGVGSSKVLAEMTRLESSALLMASLEQGVQDSLLQQSLQYGTVPRSQLDIPHAISEEHELSMSNASIGAPSGVTGRTSVSGTDSRSHSRRASAASEAPDTHGHLTPSHLFQDDNKHHSPPAPIDFMTATDNVHSDPARRAEATTVASLLARGGVQDDPAALRGLHAATPTDLHSPGPSPPASMHAGSVLYMAARGHLHDSGGSDETDRP